MVRSLNAIELPLPWRILATIFAVLVRDSISAWLMPTGVAFLASKADLTFSRPLFSFSKGVLIAILSVLCEQGDGFGARIVYLLLYCLQLLGEGLFEVFRPY